MSDYIMVGLTTVITCYIIIRIFVPPEQKIELDQMNTYILAFIIGVVVHFITEMYGLSDWYKSKRYLTAIKMLSS